MSNLHVKFLALDKCVVTSLIYACEVWGRHYRDVEPIYRCCIKTALGIRPGTNNEIVYIEAGKHPLEGRIKSLQHKFWSKMIKYTVDNPDSAIAKVLRAGRACNLPYLRYYDDLHRDFSNPRFCENSIDARHRQMWREAMVRESDDSDSKLGTYIRVNPELKPFITPPNTLEGERTIITRFRTGSHSLAIELGRFSKVPRERRLCKCGNSVQTVLHVFNDCPLTVSLIPNRFDNIHDLFNDPNIGKLIMKMAAVLKVNLG